ncbi:MAG TPA: HNH endonuclease signature motif containing protein [Tepidisphaeraceae bacterium]|nr:HNH endonuclease signature motif containing protein [Tepidisphaeraceae bacterium]
MSLSVEIIRLVEARAAGRCEYCRMYQVLQGATFHVEHILPRSKGGTTEPGNLAWCCPSCNLHKASRVEGTDPHDGSIVPLYHPRRDAWTEHFRIENYRAIGLTAVGRATIELLRFNEPRRLRIRKAEELIGLL